MRKMEKDRTIQCFQFGLGLASKKKINKNLMVNTQIIIDSNQVIAVIKERTTRIVAAYMSAPFVPSKFSKALKISSPLI